MKFHPLFFFVILLTAYINYVSCHNVDVQFETLINLNGQLYVQSTSWDPDTEQLEKKCQNFDLTKNLTRYAVKVDNCKRQFLNGEEWDQMEAREQISTYCDDNNWTGYIGCVMPNLQNYIATLFQCQLGSEWSSPSQTAGKSLLDVFQYTTFKLIPRVIKSAWTMQCSNKESLANLFEANKEFNVINPSLESLLNVLYKKLGSQIKKRKINLKLASCVVNKNPKVLAHIDSTCRFIAYVDWKSAAECLFALDELNTPEVHNAVKKIYPLLEFLQDENQGGQTKREFLNMLKYEFCSVDSPLGGFFNYDDQVQKKELKQVDAQLPPAKDKLRALNEPIKLEYVVVPGMGIAKEIPNLTKLTNEELVMVELYTEIL